MSSADLSRALTSLSKEDVQELERDDAEDRPCSDITKLYDVSEIDELRSEAAPIAASMANASEREQEPEARERPREGQDDTPRAPMLLRRPHFLKWQERDAFCKMVKNYLQPQKLLPEEQEDVLYMSMNREWFQVERDGLLVHLAVSRRKRGHVLTQWVTPLTLRSLVLRVAHDDVTAQHPSVSATHAKITEHFYWRGMAEDVRTYVMSCIPCQQSKPQHTSRYKQVLMPAERMWQRLHADHTMLGVTSEEGYEYLFNVVEAR